MSDVSCLCSYETRTLIDVLLSSCQENELNSPEGILRHEISFPCSLCVIDIDNIRPVSDVVLLKPARLWLDYSTTLARLANGFRRRI